MSVDLVIPLSTIVSVACLLTKWILTKSRGNAAINLDVHLSLSQDIEAILLGATTFAQMTNVP
jgi:hypothetical protein